MAQDQFKITRFCRFSLRTLLVTTVLCGTSVGLLQRERHFCQRNELSASRLVGRGFQVDTVPGRFAWAQGLLGVKDVIVVTSVESHGYNTVLKGITDADLANLTGLSRLKTVNVGNTIVSDEGLAYFKGLSALERLHLGGTQVTNDGLPHLIKLEGLRELDLRHTKITDAGAEQLAQLGRLESLDLRNTGVTAKGVKRLQAALPNCQITWNDPFRRTSP